MEKSLVLLSGGQDSTTCLFAERASGREVHALTCFYGQRHKIELEAARDVARLADVVSFEIVRFPDGVLHGTSPLVSGKEVEHYQDAQHLPGGIEKTFVPMRNALFLVVAANRAVVIGATRIVTGVSQEDYGGYPDCREPFIGSANRLISEALGESVNSPPVIAAPLMYLNKRQTVQLAQSLPGCMEALAYSHTCYEGKQPPCGTCHSCLLRAKGFEEAGVADPMAVRLSQRDAGSVEKRSASW